MFNQFSLLTVSEVTENISKNIRSLRLSQGLKQKTLSEMSGVPLPTLKKFESTGKISLEGLIKISQALGRIDEINELFRSSQIESIEEVINKPKLPKRGSI